MSERNDLIPAALYARVSSERQDVDLSVAAQLRALRDYAEKNGYLVVREYIDEAESGRIADRPQFRKMLDEASKTDAPFQEILCLENSAALPASGSTPWPSSPCSARRASAWSPSPSTPTTLPPASSWRPSSRAWTNFTARILRKRSCVGCGKPPPAASGSSPTPPTATRRSMSRTGPRSAPGWNSTRPHDAVARRIFDLALQGKSVLDIVKTLNAEGIPTSNGKRWLKTTIHAMLTNEAYTGTLVWGSNAQDSEPPVRVEDAFPAIVSRQEFDRVARMMQSRAPKKVHPRRAVSPYLLSGLLKCETCGKAMTAAEAKSGKYTYYICHSLLKRGKGTCETPRLNAKSFEKLIIGQLREHVLTESNIRDLVKLVDEEMDGIARE